MVYKVSSNVSPALPLPLASRYDDTVRQLTRTLSTGTISPGFVLVTGAWYRREEHSNRALFWQSANAGFGIISSLVMYGIGDHAQRRGGLAAWRCISLFLGACTIVLALICFLLLGSPKEVYWMNKDEKRMA